MEKSISNSWTSIFRSPNRKHSDLKSILIGFFLSDYWNRIWSCIQWWADFGNWQKRMSGAKKKNFQIEAFKHRVVVDPKYAEKTWKILEHAIQEIYNHNASGLSFEELYRFPFHSFCIQTVLTFPLLLSVSPSFYGIKLWNIFTEYE